MWPARVLRCLLWLSGVLLTALNCSCKRPHSVTSTREAASATTPHASSTASPVAPPTSVPAASSLTVDAGHPALTERPLLDPAKGEQALAAYRRRYDEYCAGRFQHVAGDASPMCPRDAAEGKSLASGSFVEPNADEVLVQGSTGYAWAQGDEGLYLLRRTGAEYRLARLLRPGHEFQARMRLETASGLDVLVLCHTGGHMGVYPGVCGFFGRDSFEPATFEPVSNDRTEVPFIDVLACGPGFSSRVDRITLDGERLRFRLSIEEFQSRRGPKDESGPYDCTERANVKQQSHDMQYRFDGRRFQRLTPVPRPIVQAFERWG